MKNKFKSICTTASKFKYITISLTKYIKITIKFVKIYSENASKIFVQMTK